MSSNDQWSRQTSTVSDRLTCRRCDQLSPSGSRAYETATRSQGTGWLQRRMLKTRSSPANAWLTLDLQGTTPRPQWTPQTLHHQHSKTTGSDFFDGLRFLKSAKSSSVNVMTSVASILTYLIYYAPQSFRKCKCLSDFNQLLLLKYQTVIFYVLFIGNIIWRRQHRNTESKRLNGNCIK